MGYKGFIRSVSSAMRQAERDQQRRNREIAKAYKEQQKRLELEEAAHVVETYNDYIETIQSVHKGDVTNVNWQAVLEEKKPERLSTFNENEAQVRLAINNYKPSFIAKMTGKAKKEKQELEERLRDAILEDKQELEYNHAACDDWEISQKIAKGVVQKDPASYFEAIKYFEIFSDLQAFGSKITGTADNDYIIINFHVHSDEVIPKTEHKLTKSGKLSSKDMAKGKFNEMYQDYICSCVLKIARELHAYLPVKMALINAKGELLNSATGHLEEQTVLSVAIPPETLNKLNFETIDPSDSMANFKHNMKFSKTKGFQVVEEIDINSLSI